MPARPEYARLPVAAPDGIDQVAVRLDEATELGSSFVGQGDRIVPKKRKCSNESNHALAAGLLSAAFLSPAQAQQPATPLKVGGCPLAK